MNRRQRLRPTALQRSKMWRLGAKPEDPGPALPDSPKSQATIAGFDHTLITRGASVGGIGQKRQTRIRLESSTYDRFGLPRMGRNGFDSR